MDTHFLYSLSLSLSLSLSRLLSDDEDASIASRRAALYSANTVAQITSKKDTEPDRMEIDNSFGKLCHTFIHEKDSTEVRMHDDLLPDTFFL